MNELFTVVTPRDAVRLLLDRCRPVRGAETVSAGDGFARVLRTTLVANRTLPAVSRATMDGFAVQAAATFGASDASPAYLRLAGEVRMGAVAAIATGRIDALRIHTGAMMPPGADAVVMVEDANEHGAEIEVLRSVAPGENTIRAGEDIAAGSLAIPAGRRLRPQDLGGLAALGMQHVDVFARPRIAIVSTGDELVPVSQEPGPAHVRDVNAATLDAVVREAGGMPVHMGIVGDDPERLESRLRAALEGADAVVVSAGSSVSHRDITARVVERLGDPGILVHGIALRPGKPTIVAVADGTPIVGLPGNPASALVVAWRFVAPMVRALGGETVEPDDAGNGIDARLTAPVPSRPGREDYVACSLRFAAEGEAQATPIFGSSNLIFTLVRADGLIVVPLDRNGVAAGSTVRVIRP